MLRLLVLGGTHFVGRAIVEAGLAAGADVTVFNRGGTPPPAGVNQLIGDRGTGDLAALDDGPGWDVAVDTWAGAPKAVADTVAALSGRAGAYAYISSASVYRLPSPAGSDETYDVVDGNPDEAGEVDYPARKRGSELAAERFDGDVLLARAGLILGPWSNVGRLQWWLQRIARGGDVLAPGPPELSIQHIDVRDLATWVLEAATAGTTGTFNAVGPLHTNTIADLLRACVCATGADAVLRWAPPELIAAHDIQPWTELPVWLPPGELHDAMHCIDGAKAIAAGLQNRPLGQTVEDTWAWLQDDGPPALRDDRSHGLDATREAAVLADLSA